MQNRIALLCFIFLHSVMQNAITHSFMFHYITLRQVNRELHCIVLDTLSSKTDYSFVYVLLSYTLSSKL